MNWSSLSEIKRGFERWCGVTVIFSMSLISLVLGANYLVSQTVLISVELGIYDISGYIMSGMQFTVCAIIMSAYIVQLFRISFKIKIDTFIEFDHAMRSLGIIDTATQIRHVQAMRLMPFIADRSLVASDGRNILGKPYAAFLMNFFNSQEMKCLLFDRRVFFDAAEFQTKTKEMGSAVDRIYGIKLHRNQHETELLQGECISLRQQLEEEKEKNVSLQRQLNAARATQGKQEKAASKKTIVAELSIMVVEILKIKTEERGHSKPQIEYFLQQNFFEQSDVTLRVKESGFNPEDLLAATLKAVWNLLPAELKRGRGNKKK